jgi:hypothetical protein
MVSASVLPVPAVLMCVLLGAGGGVRATAQADASAVQQAYLKASNTDAHDQFVYSMAMSGDTLVIGAPSEESAATGVNGDEDDNSADFAGAVYVFVGDGSTWTQQAYLKASNTGPSDGFGISVSISGDTLVVGARGESSSATGVDGDESDDSAEVAGAAYVFVRDGTTWTQQAYLKASNTDAVDRFGSSVSVSGDRLVVGADFESSDATGVDGDQADDSADQAGAAYVFVRDGSTWSQQAYLKASNTDPGDYFGTAVALSGDILVVGAPGEDSSAAGVNGSQSGNFKPNSGAAYVFEWSDTEWLQTAYLKASNSGEGDGFGAALSLEGQTVVVGAEGEDSLATGVNGNQSSNGAPSAGAAYVFARGGSTWSQQAYVKASNTGEADRFGCSVAVFEDTLVVGAEHEDSSAKGVDGDQGSNGSTNAGAAYVFVRSATNWSPHSYLKASNTDTNDYFGWSVALSEESIVVGAVDEDSQSTGIGGNQTNNDAIGAGAGYVFELGPWIDLGFGMSGTTGWPWLFGTGPLTAGSSNQLSLIGAEPSAAAILVVGLSALYAPFKGGLLVPSPLVLVFTSTNPSGQLFLPFTWPANGPAGVSLHFQLWVSDSAGPAGFAASNGLKGTSG